MGIHQVDKRVMNQTVEASGEKTDERGKIMDLCRLDEDHFSA